MSAPLLSDEIKTALTSAVSRAPSSHNQQPWSVSYKDNSLIISPDFTYHLDVSDQTQRELYICLGAAAENAIQVAKEFNLNAEAKLQIESKHAVIVINFTTKNNDERLSSDPLGQFVHKRQTNRFPYNGNSVPDHHINALFHQISEQTSRFYSVQNRTPKFTTLTNFSMKGNEKAVKQKGFIEEIIRWFRFNSKEEKRYLNGISYRVMGIPATFRFSGIIAMKWFFRSSNLNKKMLKQLNGASHLIILATKSDTVKEWVSLGMSLERILLKATQLGISYSFMNQLCLDDVYRSEMMKLVFSQRSELAQVMFRIGYTNKPCPYSVRRPNCYIER